MIHVVFPRQNRSEFWFPSNVNAAWGIMIKSLDVLFSKAPFKICLQFLVKGCTDHTISGVDPNSLLKPAEQITPWNFEDLTFRLCQRGKTLKALRPWRNTSEGKAWTPQQPPRLYPLDPLNAPKTSQKPNTSNMKRLKFLNIGVKQIAKVSSIQSRPSCVASLRVAWRALFLSPRPADAMKPFPAPSRSAGHRPGI